MTTPLNSIPQPPERDEHVTVPSTKELMDFTFEQDDDEGWQIWTPDDSGAVLGSGATREAAIEDARRNMLWLAERLAKLPNLDQIENDIKALRDVMQRIIRVAGQGIEPFRVGLVALNESVGQLEKALEEAHQ